MNTNIYIPEDNRKNPTKCAGNWGTEDEFQCGSLSSDQVFNTGGCEHPLAGDDGFLYVSNIYKRPARCPYNAKHEAVK